MNATISNDSLPIDPALNGRWRFDWVLPALLQPRMLFPRIAAAANAIWLTPLAVIVIAALSRIYVAGSIKAAAAASGQLPIAPEYYTPEQQAQFQQAIAATSGPIFTYVLPAVLGVVGLIFGWLLLSWILHLVLTMMGGRGSTLQALNVVAWASLPFAVRDGVRTVAMLNSDQLLEFPGLSGFVATDGSNLSIFLFALLALVDLYLLLHILYTVIGMRAAENISSAKMWTGVLVTIIVLLALRALPALIGAQFEDLTVIRPFF